MDLATDKETVASFVGELLAASGWELGKIRARGTRLEPPDWFWTSFSVTIKKDDEERDLRLIAKGALNPEAWEKLSSRLLASGGGQACDPLGGVGYPVLFPETRHAYWFYPFDPRMAKLPLAADPKQMAAVLLGIDYASASAEMVDVERVRYVPEVGAILRYTLNKGGPPARIYGKAQPGNRGWRTYKVVEQLWEAAARYPGYLYLPKPLGFVEEFGLLLEEAAKGRPVSNNRASAEFAQMGAAAADALAVIHESRLESDEHIEIKAELERLDRVLEQFAYVFPSGHFLLRDLVIHMREAVNKTEEEEWLATHGDMKYDQFMFHNDQFTLLDFDYWALTETSYDLGKFCAYLIPSHPKDWADSAAAERVRADFIRRYRELRPHATLQRFGIYEALQLALRAMSFMWAQVPDWQRIAETYLVLGFERLKSRLPE
jgi:hypothetical protein